MSSYLIQASALTKIFLEDWHEEALRDPTSLFAANQKFVVEIPRPCGAIRLHHNVPTLASSLLVKTKERMVQDDEVSPLVDWLTNEANAETDIYGVVSVPIETNVADAIMALMYDEKGADKQGKLLAELKKNIGKNIATARERADVRVLRQCGKMYDTVRSTVQVMKKDGKGVYSPSYAESLAMTVLQDQIALKRRPNDKAQALFDKAMAGIQHDTEAHV
jgi:hypothetical protein